MKKQSFQYRLPLWQDDVIWFYPYKNRPLFNRTSDWRIVATLKPFPRKHTLKRWEHFRNPASRHRSARKQVRIRTPKNSPNRFLQDYYVRCIERLKQHTTRVEGATKLDDG